MVSGGVVEDLGAVRLKWQDRSTSGQGTARTRERTSGIYRSMTSDMTMDSERGSTSQQAWMPVGEGACGAKTQAFALQAQAKRTKFTLLCSRISATCLTALIRNSVVRHFAAKGEEKIKV